MISTSTQRPALTRVRAQLEYDGAAFLGFQRQATGRSVQGTLEAALASVVGQEIRVIAAGRTDRGVHATGQVVHFDYLPTTPVARLPMALASRLPTDLAISECVETSPSFHARYSALARTYEYTLLLSERPSPLRERYMWRAPQPLDLARMNEAAALFLGEHDFRWYGDVPGVGEQRQASLSRHGWRRVVTQSSLRQQDDILIYTIEANAFLTHMARAIVGTLVRLARGTLTLPTIANSLTGQTLPQPLAPLAPPHGLCLRHVTYATENMPARHDQEGTE